MNSRAAPQVLLTKPPVGKYPLGYDLYPPMIPMGLGFLARALADHAISYIVSDQYLASFESRRWDRVAYQSLIADYHPSHVCVSSMSVEWPEALSVIQATREVLPHCQILAGGPHAHFASSEIATAADWVVVGEGERALPDLLRKRLNLQYVNGNIIEYPFLDPLDSFVVDKSGRKEMIPWTDFSPLTYDLCMPEWGLERRPVVNMNTSRGCPFSCKFCSILGPWGRGFRYFSAPVIVEEIEHLQERYGVKGVCFREDNFTVLRSRVEEMCRLLIERGLDVDWAAEARVAPLDEPLLDLMSRAGCKGLLFGVESGSERMLRAMKKEITTNDTRNAFTLCRKYGIKTYCSIVYGLPGEQAEDRQITRAFLSEIQPGFLEESVYLGIPGSAYYSELRRSGEYEFFDPMTLHIYPRGYKELYSQLIGNANGVLPY